MPKSRINDPNLIFIEIDKGQGRSKSHNNAVALISALIHRAGYEVNYDHIVSTTPRNKDIPLILANRKGRWKADIAFWMDRNTLVTIEIRTFKRGTFTEVENG